MDERKLERMLMDLLEQAADDEELQSMMGLAALGNARVKSYEDAGVLTRNRGLVLRLADGSEFQMDIIQSARAEGDEDEEEVA